MKGKKNTNSNQNDSSTTKAPFDIHMFNSKEIFPEVDQNTSIFESELADALHSRIMEISNEISSKIALHQYTYLIDQVDEILQNFQNAPQSFIKYPIDDIIRIDSTSGMLDGRLSTAMVLMLNYYPSPAIVNDFTRRFSDMLKQTVFKDFSKKDTFKDMRVVGNENVIAITTSAISIFIHSTVRPEHVSFINDSKVRKNMTDALIAIRHKNFIQSNANSNLKVLSRILQDISTRHKNLSVMTPWMFDLLSYYAMFVSYSFQPLPLNQAFLRVLRLLAVGILTPDSVGILDPCENYVVSIHAHLKIEEQEKLMEEAQKVLMEICKKEFANVLGLKQEINSTKNVAVDVENETIEMNRQNEKQFDNDITMVNLKEEPFLIE